MQPRGRPLPADSCLTQHDAPVHPRPDAYDTERRHHPAGLSKPALSVPGKDGHPNLLEQSDEPLQDAFRKGAPLRKRYRGKANRPAQRPAAASGGGHRVLSQRESRLGRRLRADLPIPAAYRPFLQQQPIATGHLHARPHRLPFAAVAEDGMDHRERLRVSGRTLQPAFQNRLGRADRKLPGHLRRRNHDGQPVLERLRILRPGANQGGFSGHLPFRPPAAQIRKAPGFAGHRGVRGGKHSRESRPFCRLANQRIGTDRPGRPAVFDCLVRARADFQRKGQRIGTTLPPSADFLGKH